MSGCTNNWIGPEICLLLTHMSWWQLAFCTLDCETESRSILQIAGLPPLWGGQGPQIAAAIADFERFWISWPDCTPFLPPSGIPRRHLGPENFLGIGRVDDASYKHPTHFCCAFVYSSCGYSPKPVPILMSIHKLTRKTILEISRGGRRELGSCFHLLNVGFLGMIIARQPTEFNFKLASTY